MPSSEHRTVAAVWTAFIRGDESSIECNECGAVVRMVARADVQGALDEMELSLGMCSEMCRIAGRFFPGFTKMTAYTCSECGLDVEIGDS